MNELYVPSIGKIYYKGNASLLQNKIVGIVGTRNASAPGLMRASLLSKRYSECGYSVLSGLAVGIDTAVHSASLSSTIAVLPTPINAPIYPKENTHLATDILRNGSLLISPFKEGSPLTKFSFIFRDRVQALLSSFLIVVESSSEGGSMHALKSAASNNRSVYIFNDEKRLSGLSGTKNIHFVDFDDFFESIS